MTTGATGQLGLALPVQGELSGTWGDTVNNGITQYTNIAIAATLTLTNDGAVTLANTTGDASASNITSSLTGAGTVTAQFAIVRITGTLTTTKVVTGPSYSKTYVVVNAATGGTVTFKASGQTGVSIAVGESAYVYYNGTDYVKVAGTSAVSSFSAGTTGLTPSTATTGAVTLAGTLATANGGTNLTSFTSGGVLYASSTSALATGSALTFDGSSLFVGATSAAAGKLVVKDTASSNTLWLVGRTSDGASSVSFRNAADSAYTGRIEVDPTNGMLIGTTGATTQLTLNTSGNLGLGVTPSGNFLFEAGTTTAAGRSFKLMTLTGGYSGGNYPFFGYNFRSTTTSGVYKYDATDVASAINFSGGIAFNIAASGTAGNNITWSTPMALDTAGYLSGVWADKVTALGNTGTATTITCTSGNVFTATLTGNCTFTLSAPSTTTANTATSFTLILTNDATAGRTVAFSGGTFKYPGGSVTRTTTANAVDIWFFFSPNGGTTWYVSIPMANLS